MENNKYIKRNSIFNLMKQLIYIFLMEKEFYHWNRNFVNIWQPKLYTEKINYLRIFEYCNNPKVTECVDKCEVKNYLKRMGKEDLCAKTYGIYDKAEDIRWKSLPNSFVIKCNHGSGYNYICEEKAEVNTEKIVSTLKSWMREDYWKLHTELVYKNINKKILIEEYLGKNIQTYRFCCFNGVPKVVYISTTQNGKDYFDYYDLRWRKTKMNRYMGTNTAFEKPECLEEMVELAAELSRPFPFVRVDLYEIKGKIYFSEFTFLPAGGYFVPSPKRFNEAWGRWLKIQGKD